MVQSDNGERRLFPETMVPVLSLSTVADEWPAHIRLAITTQHLYRYLNFTVHLESSIVNPALLSIFNGRAGVPLNESGRLDALRMYTDEAYHTLVAYDVAQQVERETGLLNQSKNLPGEAFATGFQRLIESSRQPDLKSLLHLVFVIVSETLISGNLRKVASSRDLDEGVKGALGDHARDEGRHHAFFKLYLRELWAHLSRKERRVVGLAVPEMIGVFFAPEQDSVRRELMGYDLNQSQVSEALDAAYEPIIVSTAAMDSSARLIEYLYDLGALEDSQVADAFAAAGLVMGDLIGSSSWQVK